MIGGEYWEPEDTDQLMIIHVLMFVKDVKQQHATVI